MQSFTVSKISDAAKPRGCAARCSHSTECVTAIYDRSNNQCYLRSSLVDMERSIGSGVSVLYAICEESELQVKLKYSGPQSFDCIA